MAEQLYNSMVSYIADAGGLDDIATSFTIIDTALFPDLGDYRVCVDQEVMVVSAHSSGTLTVTRGAEGTTATAHAFQAAVFIVWTAGGLLALFVAI